MSCCVWVLDTVVGMDLLLPWPFGMLHMLLRNSVHVRTCLTRNSVASTLCAFYLSQDDTSDHALLLRVVVSMSQEPVTVHSTRSIVFWLCQWVVLCTVPHSD